MRGRQRITRLLLVALCTASLAGAGAHAAAACSETGREGGEWTSYGHDLSQTRTQPLERSIGLLEAARLEPKKVFSIARAVPGATGVFHGTPAVAGGCLFVAANDGNVFALDADTLDVVWQRKLLLTQASGLGGAIVGSAAAADGKVFVFVNESNAPYAVALDQRDGSILWQTVKETLPGAYTNSSPVVFEGMVFAGISGAEGRTDARGAFALLDAETGALIKKTYTIPDDDYAPPAEGQPNKYAGGSVWATPAIDIESKYAYVGLGNPASEQTEHLHTNSIVKIDLDRSRETFGEIIGVYKGNDDQFFGGLRDQPACEHLSHVQYLVWSVGCLQLDLDFGASPNLFRSPDGRLLVGELQKSGVYHAVDTETMEQAWTRLVGAPCFACNAASTAFDGTSIVGVGTPGGQAYSLSTTGSYRWAAPVLDGLHFQPVSTANGVAYVVDGNGFLNGFAAETGAPVLKRSIAADVGRSVVGLSSAGVAIAYNTVYAAAAGYIVAYR